MAIQFEHECDHFAALLKNVLMGCPDSVITEPLLRSYQVKLFDFGPKASALQ